jgi:hypothetical protein
VSFLLKELKGKVKDSSALSHKRELATVVPEGEGRQGEPSCTLFLG